MPALLELHGASMRFDGVQALDDVSIEVPPGSVTCLLGDNGAGKSTLIKVLSGEFVPDSGQLAMEGEPVHFKSPKDALNRGIATVYQDLAVFPLLPIVRNFFAGREPVKGRGPLRRVDWAAAESTARSELSRVSIRLNDPRQAVGTLSGGQRQSVAIARAMYFGAKVLILDEPTSALGVREASRVLKHVNYARENGVGVVLISHNVVHAMAVGDRFVVLAHGQTQGEVLRRGEVTREELQDLMAGGAEVEELVRSVDEDDDR